MTQVPRTRQLDLLRRWIAHHIHPDPIADLVRREAYGAYQTEVGLNPVDEATFHRIMRSTFDNIAHSGRAATYTYHGLQLLQQSLRNDQNQDLGLYLANLKSTVPTLRHVPRGARLEVARALTATLRELCSSNTVPVWRKLLLFSYKVLRVPEKSEKIKNLTSFVKKQASVFLESSGVDPEIPLYPTRSSSNSAGHGCDVKKIEAKLADCDISGAIRLAISEDSIAPQSAETLAALQGKHPEHPQPMNLPDCDNADPPIQFETTDVINAISTFPPGSAGGLDGLRPQILKELLHPQLGETGENLAVAITDLCNMICNGNVLADVAPILFGASLTALIKKCGGIRPVAVGNVWRRLPSKLITKSMLPSLVPKLSPFQLGVGIRSGAEIGAHVGRTFFQDEHETPKLFVKLDFRNAFNELRRDQMLAMIKTSFPQTLPFFTAAYGKPSFLYYNNNLILSQRGIQQGDPAGPALFAATIHPMVEAIQAQSPDLNIWFLDDGTLGGEPERVLCAISVVQSMGEERGLHLNISKCEVAVLGTTLSSDKEQIQSLVESRFPGMKEITDANATLLGAPLSSSATEAVLDQKTAKLKVMAETLKRMSSHSALFLLRISMALPRLLYFLRAAPCWRQSDLLQVFDEVIRTTLESILNCQLQGNPWIQATLPVRDGGLGIRRSIDLALPCFLASMHSALPSVLLLYPKGIEKYELAIRSAETCWSGGGIFELPDLPIRTNQAEWDRPLTLRVREQLLANTESVTDKARLLAVAEPNAGAWLQAIPSPQLGTLLSDEAVRLSCALRLGSPACFPHSCPCGSEVNELGTHGLHCKKSAGRRSRHSAINDIIGRAFRTAEIPVILEPTGVSRHDGKHPDGLTMIPWSRGKELLWDVTVRDTLAPSYVRSSASEGGAVAAQAEAQKISKYQHLTDRYIFLPVAFETLGGWGKIALRLVKQIGTKIASVSGDNRSTQYLIQRISIALQRGNAASMLGSLPSGQKLDEVFLL